MKIPTYTGQPLSALLPIPIPESTLPLWTWGAIHAPLPNTLETIDRLISQGFQRIPPTENNHNHAHLISQCCDVELVDTGNHVMDIYASHDDAERIHTYPVTLACTLDLQVPDETEQLYLLQFLPPRLTGEYGIVTTKDHQFAYYHISLLEWRVQQLWQRLTEAIETLAEPFVCWVNHTPLHSECVSELHYQRKWTDLHSYLLATAGKDKQIKALINDLEEAHRHVTTLRQSWLKPDWLVQWMEIRRMAQELSAEYYEYHESLQKKTLYPLPNLPTSHKTILPSVPHMRGLAQSFGPHVTHSLWNDENNQEQVLKAPNGARLAVRAENGHEQKALHQFLEGGIGVEGIKYMVALLAIYHEQTGAPDRKTDARVSLRQILQFMGKGDHADDLDEQRKLMHYILYLSRTWITALDKIYDQSHRRGRPREGYLEYSPLIVLEALGSDVRGGIRIPDIVEFHLGKEYWDQMFGQHQHFFTLPTLLLLNYHSKDQSHEICLAFYLANMINLNFGEFNVHFPTLLIQTGIQDQEGIQGDQNRLRDALRILYALERLEIDLLIKREPHPDVDQALAVDYYKGKTTRRIGQQEISLLSDATKQRIENAYRHFQALASSELQTKQRTALQNLLKGVAHNTLKFTSGPLINAQIQRRRHQQIIAIQSREKAQEAAQKKGRKRKKS